MNERITLLAKQVDACYITRYDMWQMDTETMEKFAELIVRECIDKIEDIAESSNNPQPIYRVAVELLEHFGVDE